MQSILFRETNQTNGENMKEIFNLLDEQSRNEILGSAIKKLDSIVSEYGYAIVEKKSYVSKTGRENIKKDKPGKKPKESKNFRVGVEIHGHKFKSIAKAAEFFKVPASAFYTARARGIDFEDVVKAPQKKSLEIDNQELIFQVDKTGSVITKRRTAKV
jgi:hypothetical protein